MGEDVIRNTDIAHIEELLVETIERAKTVHNKAYELNNRAAQPAGPKTKEEEVPTGDVGIEIRAKLIRINTILVEAITSLEAFV